MTSDEPGAGPLTLRPVGSAAKLRAATGEPSVVNAFLAEHLQDNPETFGTVYDVIEHEVDEQEDQSVRFQVWNRSDGDIIIYEGDHDAWLAYEEGNQALTDQVMAALGDAIYEASPAGEDDERRVNTAGGSGAGGHGPGGTGAGPRAGPHGAAILALHGVVLADRSP